MKYSAQDITRALGGHWHGKYGTARCPCHDDKTASLKISDKPDPKSGGTRLDVHCFAKCSWLDIKAELVKRGLVEPWRATSLQVRHTVGKQANAAQKIAEKVMRAKAEAEADADEKKRIGAALKLWDKAVPLEGTLGGAYLRVHRGLEFTDGSFDHCLRWHKGKQMIVAAMRDASTGMFTGVQRVLLDEHGHKINRMMLGKAGICQISPDEDVLEGLHLCEGIEKSIAAWGEGLRPVWATLSAGMMGKFPVLSGIESLTLLLDDDKSGTGQDAAAECAERWIARRREVRILSVH